jgi:hypothetical protein
MTYDLKKMYGLNAHTTPTRRKPFVVKTSSSRLGNNCYGKYANVAVIETDGITKPKMISERPKGVIRIIRKETNCNMGTTLRSSFGQACEYAVDLCEFLNSLPVPVARQMSRHDLYQEFCKRNRSNIAA